MKMKKFMHLMLAGILAIGFMASCSEDEDDDSEDQKAINNDEAAEVLSSTLTDSVSGVYSQMGSMNSFISGVKSSIAKPADVAEDSTFTASFEGPNRNFNYNIKYEWEFEYVGGEMVLNFSYEMEGTYNGPNIEKTTSDSAGFTISGVQSESMSVNGSSEHEGDITLKKYDNKTYNYSISYQYTDISVSTSSNVPGGGEVSYQMSGTNQDGQNYDISGTITMNDNGTAQITINGENYILDLATGDISHA